MKTFTWAFGGWAHTALLFIFVAAFAAACSGSGELGAEVGGIFLTATLLLWCLGALCVFARSGYQWMRRMTALAWPPPAEVDAEGWVSAWMEADRDRLAFLAVCEECWQEDWARQAVLDVGQELAHERHLVQQNRRLSGVPPGLDRHPTLDALDPCPDVTAEYGRFYKQEQPASLVNEAQSS